MLFMFHTPVFIMQMATYIKMDPIAIFFPFSVPAMCRMTPIKHANMQIQNDADDKPFHKIRSSSRG
jgi:hypothetical protein